MSCRSNRCTRIDSISLDVLENEGEETSVRSSTISFIDLADSSRILGMEGTGGMLREELAIRKSLNSIGNVIYALTTTTHRHIPYRDSKLTYMMKNSLGNNCKTLMMG